MVFLNIYLDNLYLYKDFEINFTYPRKLSNSTIDSEYLKNFPNFKYRKVNIIMGANSSGKTSLGRIMMNLQNLLAKKELNNIPFNKVNNKKKVAKIKVDFVSKEYLYRYELTFNNQALKKEIVFKTKLQKNDSYQTAVKRLKLINKAINPQSIQEMELGRNNFNFGWYYSFAMLTDNQKITVDKINSEILTKILKGFDCTIKEVNKVPKSSNSFNIVFLNGDNILIKDGQIVPKDKERISSGTYESIRIATIISEMINEERNYFIDENIVHSHTELEKAVLSLMIDLLHQDSQLFFTTHNTDILDMNLPAHTIQFLTNKMGKIQVFDVFQKFNKSDRSLRNFIENDIFNTLPDTDFILEILKNE